MWSYLDGGISSKMRIENLLQLVAFFLFGFSRVHHQFFAYYIFHPFHFIRFIPHVFSLQKKSKMVYGVPMRDYLTTVFMAFGSMMLGSQVVHLWMKPSMEVSTDEHMEQ